MEPTIFTDNNSTILRLNGSAESVTLLGLAEEQLILALKPDLYYFTSYAYILWYIIGVPSNTMAFFGWIQREMLNSSGCYMAALALTDNLFLILHCVVSASKWLNPKVSIFNHPAVCQLLPLLYTAAQFMSGLLVLEFTVEQYIAICHPFKRSRYCRVSIARKVIAGVAIFALALSAPQAYFFVLVPVGSGENICDMRQSIGEGGPKSFWTVWTWTSEMLMFGFVPLSCLVLNLLVIYQVIKQRDVKLLQNVHTNSAKQSSLKRLRRRGATTIMLLVVSLYWVCTELPATITLCIKPLFEIPHLTDYDEARKNKVMQQFLQYMTVKGIVEIMCFSRYSSKLFLYLATGRQFRKYLTRRLIRCNKNIHVQWSKRLPSYRSGTTATKQIACLLYNNNINEPHVLHSDGCGSESESLQHKELLQEDTSTEMSRVSHTEYTTNAVDSVK